MQRLTLRTRASEQTVIRHTPPRVYIDGRRRHDLLIDRWELTISPPFGRVELMLRKGLYALPRIEESHALPPVGASVHVQPVDGIEDFRGVILAHCIRIDENGEQLIAEAQHWLSDALEQTVSGRWEIPVGGAMPIWVEPAEVNFSTQNERLASGIPRTFNGRLACVFDSSKTARPWSVAEALGYLLAATVDSDIHTPSLNELNALAGDIALGAMDITGLSVKEALTKIARYGGLAMRPAAHGRGLVFYRPGGSGRRRSVRLQRPGTTLSRNSSNLCAGYVQIRRRPSRPALLARGARKRYEATFTLCKGWDAGRQTARWRDFIRSEADNWPAVADVYRKWVLNEHGRYSDAPYNLPVYDFSPLSEEDFFLKRSRPFLPCLSTDATGQSLGIVVEYKAGESSKWTRWTGPVWVDDTEGTIYLDGDALPADYFTAAVEDKISLRVTVVVEADARMEVEIPGDANLPRQIVNFADHAGWATVHTSSIFKEQTGLGTPAEKDDTELLTNLARRCIDILAASVDAKLTLAWVDTSYRPGDQILRIDGRALGLTGNPDTRPFVQAVTHQFGEKQTTTLNVSG